MNLDPNLFASFVVVGIFGVVISVLSFLWSQGHARKKMMQQMIKAREDHVVKQRIAEEQQADPRRQWKVAKEVDPRSITR